MRTLSDREREVLALVSKGYLDKEIAFTLKIAVQTCKNHQRKIRGKLHLRNRSELTRYAIENPNALEVTRS